MALTDAEQKILAANLIAAREKRHWNTTYAAGRAGIPISQLSMWENARREPELAGLLRLAVAYECRIDDFLGGMFAPYDTIIESSIPLDVQRHYDAREDAFILRTMTALEASLSSRARERGPQGSDTGAVTDSEKSARARPGVENARRKRKQR